MGNVCRTQSRYDQQTDTFTKRIEILVLKTKNTWNTCADARNVCDNPMMRWICVTCERNKHRRIRLLAKRYSHRCYGKYVRTGWYLDWNWALDDRAANATRSPRMRNIAATAIANCVWTTQKHVPTHTHVIYDTGSAMFRDRVVVRTPFWTPCTQKFALE